MRELPYRGRARSATVRPSVGGEQITPFFITGFVETLTESVNDAVRLARRSRAEPSDHRHRRLLCACRERPRGCCAAEKRDELAPVHSITSSAVASSLSGTVSPSILAV